jgi:hypothetical protein
MSTIPFTLIQGSLALPRLRPLAQLPTPFGRDWSLLPPGYSVRAELRALYAAMLRTFCLSDEAMRALCNWRPLRGSSLEDGGPEETVVASAMAQAAALDLPPRPIAAPLFETVRVPRKPAPAKGTSPWLGMAGGVCALSGAAVLAWIAAGHVGHGRVENGGASAPGAVSASPANVTAPAVTHDSSVAPAVPSATEAHVAQQSSQRVAPSAPDFSTAAPRVSPSVSAGSGSAVVRMPPALPPAQALRGAVQSSAGVSSGPAPHAAPARTDTAGKSAGLNKKAAGARHHAAPASVKPARRAVASAVAFDHVPAHGTARPSSAGAYSPLAPSRLGVDEYAGITMSAATPVQRLAPPARVTPRVAPSAATSQSTSATEWSNHMSQRRVTEVPDQFGQ